MTIGAAQRLLIRALCLEPAGAREAWSAWRRGVALDDVDEASFELLPALARRPELVAGDPDEGRLRGIYRHAWVRNTLVWERAEPAIKAVVDAGLPIALLGAAAMPRFYDGDRGIRPMPVVDLLGRPPSVAATARLLTDGGWPRAADDTYGGIVRLHARADDALWRTAARRPDGAHEIDASGLLLHLLSADHGAGIAWIADAHRLCRGVDAPAGLASLAAADGVLGTCIERLETVAGIIGSETAVLRALRRTAPGRLAVVARRGPSRAVRAVLGRRRAIARGLGRAAVPERAPLATTGALLDLTDPGELVRCGGSGWGEVGPLGAHSRGREARLLLPVAGALTLVLDFARDQTAPVLIDVDGRTAGSTPGRGGPARVALAVAGEARTIEVALRSSEPRPRPLNVILRAVSS